MKESQHLEWKETWRDEFLKWICGFANADGGVLVVGRDDDGAAVGIDNARRLLEEIPNKARDILGMIVDVHLLFDGEKELIEIHVPAYPSPISYKGAYYCRSGSTLQELKGSALERFLLRKRGRHWDGVPEPSLSSDDFSADAFRLFARKAEASGRMGKEVLDDSPEAILDNLELTEGQLLKRAAALLFTDRPERYVSGARIKIGFFNTDDDLRYQDEIRGNLFAQVERTFDLLFTKYLKAYIGYEGLQRRERFLFPEEALREAVLNAVIHKDYGSGIPIQISVYADRLVIWNPGSLPPGWTLERLFTKHPSSSPNPLLADAFFYAGYVETWGRGIEKIERECREHGIAAPIYEELSGLMITFHADPIQLKAALEGDRSGENGGDRLGEEVGETRAAIVRAMAADPTITTPRLAAMLNITASAVEKGIRFLKRRGYIERVGAARGGQWRVEEPSPLASHGRKAPVETTVETTVETPERIIALLRTDPTLTLAEVAAAIGKSVRAVERASAALVKAGRLRHIGPRKGGKWEVTS